MTAPRATTRVNFCLEVGRVYRCNNDPRWLAILDVAPVSRRDPMLAHGATSDDNGRTWFSGLVQWRYLQEHCSPAEFMSEYQAFCSARDEGTPP